VSPEGQGELSNKLVLLKSTKTSIYTLSVGVSDLAQYDEQGNEFNPPKFPFRIVVQPNQQLRTTFPAECVTRNLVSRLLAIEPGRLFNVYAIDTPSSSPQLIGFIDAIGKPIGSSFGDQLLFFKHQKREEDFAFRPEWVQPFLDQAKIESETHYPNTPPNIPYPSKDA
jgi:hypothetical protein